MQGFQGQRHLPACKGEEQMQGLRGRQHLSSWKGEERMQGLQEHQHFPSKWQFNKNVGQQRSQGSVFQGYCGSSACGRRRRKRELMEERLCAGGGITAVDERARANALREVK